MRFVSMIITIGMIVIGVSDAFTTLLIPQHQRQRSSQSFSMKTNNDNENEIIGHDRRSFLSSAAVAVMTTTVTAALSSEPAYAEFRLGDKKSVVNYEIASFRELIYRFNNTALDGGLDAKTIKEPSISFLEFGDKLSKGEVAFVEFLAPSGQVAYVTLKPSRKNPKPKPVRIGEGYPTGGPNSWSSPDYVIRSVVNFNVPYVFTVPALAKVKYPKYVPQLK